MNTFTVVYHGNVGLKCMVCADKAFTKLELDATVADKHLTLELPICDEHLSDLRSRIEDYEYLANAKLRDGVTS